MTKKIYYDISFFTYDIILERSDSMNKNLELELKSIIDTNKDKRICVVGTTCTGKSTLIKNMGIGADMDKLLFPLLTKEESDYVCSDPWTEEIGEFMDNLVRTKLKIVPGMPLFGTVILDADLIVYLHINDELLKERTDLRGVNFKNAKNMQSKIENELKTIDKEIITLEV